MESVIESYQKGNYEQALIESEKAGNILIQCKALLKLNQMKSAIPFGPCLDKKESEYFQKALQRVSQLSEQDKLQVQTIIDYYQDKEMSLGTTDESKFYFGLYQFEKENYEEALTTLYSVGNLENVDDKTHKYLMIAECYIRLEKYNRATKFLEHVGENSYCYALLSQCYFKLGNTQQGNLWLKESLKINQNCFYAQLNQLRQQNNIDEEIKLIEKYQDNNIRIIKQLINSYITKGSQRTTKCMGEYACRPRGECVQKCLTLIDKLQKCKATDFLKAQVLYFNYKNSEAIAQFNVCIEQNYKTLESRFYVAMIHKDQMKYKECMSEFKILSQQTPIKDDCHFWRVVIFLELHEYEQALRELEYVQTSAKNYALISKLYYLKGNKVQADIWLKEALKMDPNCFYAKVEKGAQDVKFDCITLLEQLLKEDPYNICAKEGLIKLLIQHAENSIQFSWGEYSCKPQGAEIQRALELLQQVKSVRECIKHDFYTGVVNYYLNNLQQSEELFKKCIDANYLFWTCKYYLSLIKKDQMKYKEALELSQQVADHEDQFTQACHANRAWIFIQQNLPDKAIKELEKNNHGCQYYVLLGQAYIMKGNSVQANTWFNESLKVNPDCLYAKIYKAILAQKQEEILSLLDGAQKRDTENYVIMWHRGKVLARLNKQDQALQLFDKCIQYKHHIAYASKAKVLRCQGKREEALQLGNDCLLPPIIVVKASILFDMKKYEESIQICEELCVEKNIHALRQKALALRALNRKEEALKLYDDILSIDKFNIQAFVGKAQIIKETEDIYELLHQLSDIVLHKKMYKATMNPVVVQNCLDLLKLNSEFDTKGKVIEKVIEHSQQHEKQKQELIQLKQQKEKLCAEKIECIMNPICHVNVDNTNDILKKLTSLHKQMTDLQQKQQTQIYEQLLQSTTFEEGSIEQIDFENQIKKWNENNCNSDQQNYVNVYTNLLIHHILSYSQILNEQIEQTIVNLPLGNSFVIMDQIIDNTFTMITMINYRNRMKALLKLVKSNELTNRCGNNLQLIIGLCAQTCADQIDFTKEVQSIQSHAYKYQQKFLMQQVDQFASKCQLPQLQLLSGKYAIRDVLITIAYLQHNFISLIGKSKQIPIHQMIIQLQSKHVELTTECHPINQHISEYISAFNIKDYKPEMKRTQGDSGCCIVM